MKRRLSQLVSNMAPCAFRLLTNVSLVACGHRLMYEMYKISFLLAGETESFRTVVSPEGMAALKFALTAAEGPNPTTLPPESEAAYEWAVGVLRAASRHEKLAAMFTLAAGAREEIRREDVARIRASRSLRCSEFILRLLLPRACREEILGDISEQYAAVLRSHGARCARFLVIWATLRNVAYTLLPKKWFSWLGLASAISAPRAWALIEHLIFRR